jgi:TldD protein
MNKINIGRFLIGLVLVSFFSVKSFAQDKLIGILDEEIKREMKWLKEQDVPAYYLSYRVDEIWNYGLSASFGSLTDTSSSSLRILTIALRVGSQQLDNYHYDTPQLSAVELPSPEEPLAVKQVIWNATKIMYQQAVNNFSNIKTNITLRVEEEDKSPDFSNEQSNIYVEPPLRAEDNKFDKIRWITRLKEYSSAFLNDPDIFNGSSFISYQISRKYFVSSSGDKVVQNSTSANLGFSGIIKAKDGMEMPLVRTYFAFEPDGLPLHESIVKDVNVLVRNLVALKNAPVAEPYTGPALLSGRAAGVFFHEIFGHRIEGQRMKNENDGQTFKKKVNQSVLPDFFNVVCDPQLKSFENQDLNGFYVYDDQGIKGQRVSVVEKGILKNFLMSRTPIG